jgi:hypothetical protein
MVNDKVYYIQPLSYHHTLDKNTIVNRFITTTIIEHVFHTKNMLEEFICDWFDMNNTQSNNMDNKNNCILDVFICQKIMYHIKEFFFLISRKNKTKKNNLRITNITRKNHSF